MKILLYFLLLLLVCVVNTEEFYQATKMKSGEMDLQMKSFFKQNDNKIVIKIWINAPKSDKNYHVLIDKIFDPRTQKKVKLLYPYVILLKTNEPILMYPLDYEKMIFPKCKNNSGESSITRRNISFMKNGVPNFDHHEFKNILMDIKKQENNIKLSLERFAIDEVVTVVPEQDSKDQKDVLVVYLDDKNHETGNNQKINLIESHPNILSKDWMSVEIEEPKPISKKVSWKSEIRGSPCKLFGRKNVEIQGTKSHLKNIQIDQTGNYQIGHYDNYKMRFDGPPNAGNEDPAYQAPINSQYTNQLVPSIQQQQFQMRGPGNPNYGQVPVNTNFVNPPVMAIPQEHFPNPQLYQNFDGNLMNNYQAQGIPNKNQNPFMESQWKFNEVPRNFYQSPMDPRNMEWPPGNFPNPYYYYNYNRQGRTSVNDDKIDEQKNFLDANENVEEQDGHKIRKRDGVKYEEPFADETDDAVDGYLSYKFNPPLHFLSSSVKIFQKIPNSKIWPKIFPEIILTSTSKKYVNESLVITFTPRSINVKRTNESLDIENMKLLIPKDIPIENLEDTLMTLIADQLARDFTSEFVCDIDEDGLLQKRSAILLKNIGRFPSSESILEKCREDPDHLCLNLVDQVVQPFKVVIEIPFKNNDVVDESSTAIQITNILSDATAGSNLHLQISLMSTSFVTKILQLGIDKCDLLTPLNVTQLVEVPPNRAVTVDVNLTAPLYLERKQQNCDVSLIDQNQKLIAKREFPVKPESRCLCFWLCSCLCFDLFVSTEARLPCEKIMHQNEFYDGFQNKKDAILNWNWKDHPENNYWMLPAIGVVGLIVLLLFLGFMKGFLGCCCMDVDMWKYNYLQPNVPYREASRCRKFFINLFFFLVVPFAWCCNCFSPQHRNFYKDSEFGASWSRSAKCETICSETESDDEHSRLLRSSHSSMNRFSFNNMRRDTSETVFDILNRPEEEHNDREKQLISDTEYVIGAMNDSHESLRKLGSHYSEESLNNDPKFQDAKVMVGKLLAAKVVYRKFTEHIGNVKLKEGQPYSIRGYFTPSYNTGYQFMTYVPLVQYWEVSGEGSLMIIEPNVQLDSKAFRKVYQNKIQVLEAGDLTVFPTASAPCINVKVQTPSMYELSSS